MPVTLENCYITSYQLGGMLDMNKHMFTADPVGTMRSRGITVPPDAEHAWRQLVTALQALQRGSDGSTSAENRAFRSRSGHLLHLEIQIPAGIK
jgi:hypothetical protein